MWYTRDLTMTGTTLAFSAAGASPHTFWHRAFEEEALLRSRGVTLTADLVIDAVYDDAGAPRAVPHVDDHEPTPPERSVAALLPVDAPPAVAAERLMPNLGSPGDKILDAADGMPYLPPARRPKLPEGGAEPSPQAADWLREIAFAIVEHGERLAREILRKRKLDRREVDAWIKAAKQAQLDVYLQTDLEEHKAIIVAQLDEVHAKAIQSLDLKTATTALRQKALVTGVLNEDASGGLNEFARLVKETTQAKAKMAIVYDATQGNQTRSDT